MSIMPFKISSGYKAPVGLLGLIITTPRVVLVILDSISFRSGNGIFERLAFIIIGGSVLITGVKDLVKIFK